MNSLINTSSITWEKYKIEKKVNLSKEKKLRKKSSIKKSIRSET